LPKSGPLIICSNHTNAFMDALIFGSHIPRPMKSLPRGNIFFTSGPVLRWLFNEVGMIPIFRAMEGKENLHRNEETFKRCFEVMGDGGVIHVFPEGICVPERRIKAMKKGPARIILGAEERHDFSLNTKIVFAGMNYEKAWRFKTNLFLNFSRVYSVDEFVELYKENTVKGINELTKSLKPALTNQVIHLDKAEYDNFYEQIESLYADKLRAEYKLSERNLEHRFLVSREIARGINYHFVENTEEITALQQQSAEYFQELESLKLSDKVLFNLPDTTQFWLRIAGMVLGFPIHLYGLVNNYLPAKIAKTVADKVVKKIDFYSSVTTVVGLCAFLFFYPFMVNLFWLWTNSIALTVLYASTLYLSGNYAAFYIEDLRKLKSEYVHFQFKRNNLTKFNALLLKRKNIVSKLMVLKEAYRSRHCK